MGLRRGYFVSNKQQIDQSTEITDLTGANNGNLPSPPNNPNASFLHDFNDSKSDFFSADNLSSYSLSNDDNFTEFSETFQKTFKSVTRYLPIFTILGPTFILTILKISQNTTVIENKISFEKFGLNYPRMLIDLVSIGLLCWFLKFLLDWPWDWYIQISDVKQKLALIMDSFMKDKDVEKYKKLRENLKSLNYQHYTALGLCFISPFTCGWLLFISRGYITILGDVEGVFSDLNIGIFVSCGLIRLLIQLSDYVQKLTTSIDVKTEKIIQELNLADDSDNEPDHEKERLQDGNQELNDIAQAIERITVLEKNYCLLALKFDMFYSKHKFIIENPDQSFVSSTHFKILEKELNLLNSKLNDKVIKFETNFKDIHSIIDSKASSPLESAVETTTTCKENKTSLHGIPLSSTSPTYNLNNSANSSSFLPLNSSRLENPTSAPFSSSISRLVSFLPIISISAASHRPVPDAFRDSRNADKDWSPSVINEERVNEMTNLKGISSWNLGSRPIVGYVTNAPFVLHSVFWELISFLPLKMLRIIHVILLAVLDFLVSVDDIKGDQRKARS